MSQNTRSKLHSIAALAALFALGAAAYWWQHRPAQAAAAPAPAATPVEAQPVELRVLAEESQAVGSLRARQSVMLKPEVSGRVVKLGFSDGQRVRRGQVLIQLDDSLQAAQLQQAEAQAGIARTQLQRNRELLAQSFVSASVVDQAKAALDVAEAQVALNRAQLERMRIVAPFDGVAGIRQVNLGDYVKDGAALLSLEDASSMWVDFRLPERDLPRLRKGQSVSLTLDAMPGRSFEARVEALDAQLDTAGRSMLVRARLDKSAPELKSGLFARVSVRLGERAEAVLVPEEALVPQGGKQFLIKLVDPKAELPLTEKIEAKLGQRLPGKVEVLAGLKAGDWVVTAGQSRLMRGEKQAIKRIDVDQQGRRPATASAPAGAGPSAAKP
ncbi:efflux RND transporter periplasmic adaptor subunit [Paucibacter sp. APW11]|uniref:Efflux RND transporter periplasmic adaptor subunit n=1 Tax=Roseateles aquae TaxID=3077235 RepID=A0ABU3P788_9BURK|nr:efflux RND transporter periplasmic adaptor subunit [Paucibacter sp. APW11]MDT8998446.1 efflux RND transporter periplasmic adaptor subunit [Paucibacter sp. APW11]